MPTPDERHREQAAVRVCGLTVIRGGRPVLKDVSLTIDRGAVTGLIGPSGSGKTTFLRSIVGSQVIASGEIQVFGIPAGSPTLRSRVAYVTQSLGLYPDLTVRENLGFFAKVLSAPKGQIGEVIESVHLGRQVDQLVGELSDGQRARVSLATALLGKPDLLVLDEPTAALDPILRRQLWTLFSELASTGTTLIVSSHVIDEARRCDRLILLNDGSVIAVDSPDELCRRTGTQDVEIAFLNLLEGERR
jgi:ABC-2 type transport system ATP-binding protein